MTKKRSRAAVKAKTSDGFSSKAFGQGMAVVALVYAGLFAYINSQSEKTLERLQDRLASQAVLIEHITETPAPPETAVTPDPEPAQPDITAAPPQPAVIMPPPEAAQNVEVIQIPTGPLEPAPLQDLYEETSYGKLPKISSSGLTPFNAYKRPFLSDGKPVIALVVMDYGLSEKDSETALAKLPPEVSFALTPYSADPEAWQKKAREKGHEIWLRMPMQTARFLEDDPGPKVLLAHAPLRENEDRMNWVLGRATGYAGVISETDSIFNGMHSMLGQIMKSVFSRGLGYFELNPAGSSVIETAAATTSAPFATRQGANSVYNATTTEEIETAARQSGFAARTIRLDPKNIEAAAAWIESLQTKGFMLAPLSAAAMKNIPLPETEEAGPEGPAVP